MSRPNLLIVGGGLAGSLVALALARHRPDVSFLVVEESARFGGQHVWSFFDTDLEGDARALVQPLVGHHWSDHEIAFPRRRRVLPVGYNSVRSANLDRAMRSELGPEQYRLNAPVAAVEPNSVILRDGSRMEADAVLDARGAGPMPGIELGWQKFLGRTYHFALPHGIERPMIMDGTIPQQDGYRFIYRLPFAPNQMLIEDTFYSDTTHLDVERLGAGLDQMAADLQPGATLIEQEAGVLPVLISGQAAALWAGEPVAKLGIRGGFFHPTTGYSLGDAANNAVLIAAQKDFGATAMFELLKTRAEALWNERRFYQLLNRMLFRAADPEARYKVLEHFYRLPESTVSRFYAARLTAMDKVRVLTGRPPVPVGRALHAMRRTAA